MPDPQAEHGVVMPFAALVIPVMLVICTFVIDTANWFVHKRHLQMQADAGALAAARDFNRCPDNAAILTRVAEYSGDTHNAQIGSTPPERVKRLVNSKTFYGQPDDPDDTVEDVPCAAGMVDVKLTELDLPWLFRPIADLLGSAAPTVPYINAQARVSIFQRETAQGALPVGVPDINPKSARAWFVNEETGAVLGSTTLTRTGTSNGLAVWDNAAAPLPVTVGSADKRIGVVVSLSGGNNTACGQPLVDCYDAGVARNATSGLPTQGILHIQGWSAEGSGAQPDEPRVRQVRLVNGTCADPYFSAATTACTVGVEAVVDFGTSTPVATVGAKLEATIAGTTRTLTYDAVRNVWTSPTTFSIAPGAAYPVTLRWEETKGVLSGPRECKVGGNNPCQGSFGTVQRAFAGSEARSGPIQVAQVLENGLAWANAVERCSAVQTSCTHDFVVRIGVKASLQNASGVNDPIVALRVTGGSQNQSLDCDPNKPNLKQELATGCSPTYGVNTGVACPEDPPPAVLHCVPLQTGTAINQVAEGLNLRVYGTEKPGSCTAPNNWSSYPNLPAGDPRILQVFLTPFGSFSGSGSGSVPVIGFATFYVTGWAGQGGGFKNPCEGQGDDPAPDGHIVGHFIKYIDTLNPGSGTVPCDLNALGSCVAVMTR